eukprot:IDg4080t1
MPNNWQRTFAQDDVRARRLRPLIRAKHISALPRTTREIVCVRHGFQQELFEVDLERGSSITHHKRSPRAHGDAVISCALLFLVLAAAAPVDAMLSRVLTLAALCTSAFGATILARRRPRAPARRVLALLAACWLLYAARIFVARTRPHDFTRQRERDVQLLTAWRARRAPVHGTLVHTGSPHPIAVRPRVSDSFARKYSCST